MALNTKNELSRQFQERMKDRGFSFSIQESKIIIDESIESMKDCAYEGGLSIPSFMSLIKEDKPARTARNPKTGESIEVPAKTVLKVKLAKKLKELQD